MHKKVQKTVELMLTRSINTSRAGDIIKVKRGYAENYLVPKGYGVHVAGHQDHIQAKLVEWKKQDEARKEQADTMIEQLKNLKLAIKAESGQGGSLYGSISSSTVAKELHALGIDIPKQDITMNPVKLLGEYAFTVRLYGGTAVKVDLSVVPMG